MINQQAGETPTGPTGQAATSDGVERRLPWWRSRARLILVPLDGSEEAKHALDAARTVAQLARASLEIVHAATDMMSPEELLARVGLRREETHGAVVEQVFGDPSDAIVRVAKRRRAMLIAMALHGGVVRDDRAVYPEVDAVLRQAPCPVLLVRPTADASRLTLGERRRILLPLDGTPSSAQALGPALDLADRTRAEIDILHVATQAEPPREPGSLAGPIYVDQAQYEWDDWAQEFADRFGTALGQYKPTMPIRVHVRGGDPPGEITAFARERQSDLIVMRWQPRSTGDVVGRVLSLTPCPVLLLPPHLAEQAA